jgi:large subunit ribosomal protein L14
MIYSESKLAVADNSGAKYIKCIRILSPKNYDVGTIGSILLARVVKKNHSKKIKKKVLYYGLIIMIKQQVSRYDGTTIKFSDNRVLLFSTAYKFLGSRVYGPLMKEIRLHLHKNKKEKQKYLKILSYSNSTL